MIRRVTLVLAAAFLFLAPAASHAALSTYVQSFESLVQSNPTALGDDGWLVYGNVFTPAHVYMYGYGPYPAPNHALAFCSIDAGQGGPDQGLQQLNVFSDYENRDHANGNLVESNVYREQTITAADVGYRWTFQFDAKLGNLTGATTALGFIKTLDPSAGYAMTNFKTVNTTAIPAVWNTYTLSLVITPGLVGQLCQIGFASTATHYEGSGVYYDNVVWSTLGPGVGVDGAPRSNTLELRAAAPNPFTRSTRIDYSVAQRGNAEVAIYDVVGRRVATLFSGQAEAGPHAATWDGRTTDGRLAPTGVYRCVLQTAAGRQARSLVLSR